MISAVDVSYSVSVGSVDVEYEGFDLKPAVDNVASSVVDGGISTEDLGVAI